MDRVRCVAIVDLGSNSFRLVVFRYEPGGAWTVWDEMREPVRLGEGMGPEVILRPEPIARALETTAMFAAFCRDMGVEDVLVAGTSALRRAANGAEVVAAVEGTGLPVRVLDEREEAHYGARAILGSTSVGDGYGLDMGGGSVQLMRLAGGTLSDSVSLPLGAVRVTEDHLPGARATRAQLKAIRHAVRDELWSAPWWSRADELPLAAIGGSVRNLAGAAQRAGGLPNGGVQGFELRLEQVEALVEELAAREVSERGALPGINPDRGDVILGAAVVLETLMRRGGFDALEVTEAGLREGLFFEHYLQAQSPATWPGVRAESVRNLQRRTGAEPEHAARVTRLALELYDGLVELGLRPAAHDGERELLEAAAALHDVGRTLGFDERHKHARHLILSDGLPGFSRRETALIALAVRYSAKGTPSAAELGPMAADGDDERLSLVAGVLRLAERLDRTRGGRVDGVEVSLAGDELLLDVRSAGGAEVERWSTATGSALLASALGRRVCVVAPAG